MEKIAIIYPTFLRSELVKKTLPSVLKYSPENSEIFVGDQSSKLTDKQSMVDNLRIHYYLLPFDCGVSYARNYLVQRAHEMGYKYCIITADNIGFTAKYDFTPVIEFLESDINNAIVAFGLRSYHWEYNLKIEDGEFVLIKNNEPTTFNGIVYYKYDLVKQFYLAKTEVLLKNKWDDRLKLTEHIEHLWRLKQETSYKVYCTSIICADRINDRPKEYKKYRDRQYSNEFRDIVKKKWGLTGWLKGRK